MSFDTLGPLYGYRLWRVWHGRLAPAIIAPRLRAWGSGAARCEREEPGASLLHDPRKAPADRCLCGYYAYRKLDDLVREWEVRKLFWLYSGSGRPPIVVGRVKLWGKVIPHELGWRAEYAAPVAIFDLPEGVQVAGLSVEPLPLLGPTAFPPRERDSHGHDHAERDLSDRGLLG